MTRPYFITTAISYPNGPPHIGHAYEAIATDVIARFHRLAGKEVYFLTGTDDHGQKMFQTARNQNMTPLELADQLTPRFRDMVSAFKCSNDDFIRTSEDRHYKAVAAIWQRMADNGDIYKDSYAGWYSIRDEAFYTEAELITDKAGNKTAPSGTEVEWVEEESYFFRLSAYQDRLLDYYNSHPDFIAPTTRKNEIVSFVSGGLKDLSISRTSFNWGVPVPNEPEHVVYVWVDALTNYLTAAGFPENETAVWPAALHIIGKDITRFHAVYWPAFLMSAKLDIPEKIFAHGFLTLRGEKMSKSAGNVMDPFNMVARYGAENLRYFFMREVPFGQDGSFSNEAIVNRVNADLANDMGNLAQRSLSMIAKNCDGIMPTPDFNEDGDTALLKLADALQDKVVNAMDKLAIHDYLKSVFELVSEANRYFAEQEPWNLKKTNPVRMGTVLYLAAETIRQSAIALQPVIPEGSSKLLDLLTIPDDQRSFDSLGSAGRLTTGQNLPKPEVIFPRLEVDTET
ncbi:MAG: methionine--tRNA ligase [Pseudomonadota bacterium]|nr:methionine--tRNA ligase [Pseudomonadota bacterium]